MKPERQKIVKVVAKRIEALEQEVEQAPTTQPSQAVVRLLHDGVTHATVRDEDTGKVYLISKDGLQVATKPFKVSKELLELAVPISSLKGAIERAAFGMDDAEDALLREGITDANVDVDTVVATLLKRGVVVFMDKAKVKEKHNDKY